MQQPNLEDSIPHSGKRINEKHLKIFRRIFRNFTNAKRTEKPSVILLLVGVMNFVNTMVVNVNTRRYELAVLESIGMTKRQIKRMLFMEGFYYWGVSLSLAVTIGTAIFILLYMIFSKVAYYAVFSYPFIPLVLVSGLVLLICLIVPIWVYKTDVNLPVVERLRLTE